LMLMIGSNLIIAIAVLMVAKFVMSGAPAEEPAMGGMGKGQTNASNLEYFVLDGCQANVPVGDGGYKKVRFKVLLRFDGEAPKRTQATTEFTSGGRKEMLKDWAAQVVAKYDMSRVKDSSFPTTFENDFMARFNSAVSDYRILQASITEIE
jgi:hypothetical protein